MLEFNGHNPARRIVLTYLLAGFLWIVSSDVLIALVPNRAVQTNLSIIKGWLFIVLTATILYFLINKYVTYLVKSRQDIAANDERLKLLFQSVKVGIWDWDLQSGLAYLSTEYFEVSELEPEGVTPDLDFFKSLVHPDDWDHVIRTMNAHLNGETPDSYIEYRIITGSGSIKWIQSRGKVVKRDADGRPLRMLGTMVDNTPRKEAENQLVALNEKLQTLTEHLQTVQEQERLSIARDIHDEIGQQLTVLKLELAWIVDHTATGGELAERLRGMEASIDNLTTHVQKIAAELRPPLLDDLGLTAAIEWQVSEFTRRSGIECILMLNEDIDPCEPQPATSIVRIVQEALTNIIRHAAATEVALSLCRVNNRVLLEISDNGRGITPSEITAKNSYGVIGMQERSRLCGGELEIEGLPGGGTRLRLTIPCTEGGSHHEKDSDC